MGGENVAGGKPGRVRTFKDLIAWQKAIGLAKVIYAKTRGFPDDEKYGLVAQTRRAAVSISSSNIAEGHGRDQTGDYIRFLRIARGSAMEVESLWILSHELGYVRESTDDVSELIAEVIRVLDGLIQSLKRHQTRSGR